MTLRENPARFDVFGCRLAGTALIEASAGTGKTWTLCGLYLRLLLERRLAVQQILVVTFTNAATAELRERIRQRIAQTLAALRARQASPEAVSASGGDRFIPDLLTRLLDELGLDATELQKRLELALQSFDEAAIFTIHGFCKRALDETPFAARMPLTLELLDDDAELRAEAVNDFWRRHVAGAELPAALAAALLAKKDTPATWSTLLQRHVAKPLAETLWPARIDEVPALDAHALIAAHAAARALWRAQRETIVGGLLASMAGRLNAASYKPANVNESAAGWDAWLGGGDALAALAAPPARLALLTSGTMAAKTNKGKTPPAHPFFDLAQTCIEALDALADDSALARLRLLRRLFDEATAALREAKRARHVVAFDDMLYNLHERLHGAQAADLIATLRARFPAALIDEFQDTDPLQFEIFSTLYGDGSVPGPLFMVGDPKQAIYSFRNADLHTYLAARAGAGAEYTLTDNQRSVAPLIGALNGLFGANEQAFMMDGLAYRPVGCGAKPRTPLHDLTPPDPASTGAALRLWTLPDDSDADVATELLPKPAAKAAAAAACAGQIARLLAAAARGELLHGGQPLRAGEIAVLVRSHAQGSQMRAALREVGVGSVELSQTSVFAGSDAEELDRVLAAILEPRRTGLLLAALATELIGLTAGEIEALAADEAALQRRMQAFADYRELWLRRGIGSLLRRLYSAERTARRLLPRPDGERHLTDLLHLAELLHQASETEPAPEALLRWFQRQRDEAAGGAIGGEAAQLRLESDRNLVQIVTVHKAKGLEFPLVFCPFLWDGRSGGSPRTLEGVEYHREADGRTLIDFRPGLDNSPDNPGGYDDKAVKAAIKLETAAEHLRLIYVALTRAVHRCYLVVGSYTTGKNASATESGHSLLNWLVAGAGQTPQAWFAGKREPATISAAWQALAAAQPEAISLAPLPTGPALPLAPERPRPDSLAALPPPAYIPAGWRIGSYSGLIAGAGFGADGSAAPAMESAAADHDLRVPETTLGADAAAVDGVDVPVAADDILNFPRGAAAGVCIHALFERIDFTDASGWPAAIDATLRAHPPPVPRRAAPDAAHLSAMLANMLDAVLNVPLPVGTANPLRLADLPLSRRLTELEFHLPAQRLDAVALNRALAELGYRVPPLAFGALDGYLKGFIDLVFEHEGRYFVLDWKSNHLGLCAADYLPEALAPTMDEAAYRLQYLLYSVALDRYLARRLPDYATETHFGGVLYLFVRGLRPDWRAADGWPAGLYVDRPPVHALRRLSELLDASGDAA